MSAGLIPPRAGKYPTVVLGDGVWDRVVAGLRRSGLKGDAALADRIERQIQKTRARWGPASTESDDNEIAGVGGFPDESGRTSDVWCKRPSAPASTETQTGSDDG